MVTITKGTLDAFLLAARNTYPNEFLAFLSSTGKGDVIDEFVLLPATYGRNFSSVRLDLMPLDKSVKGSVHSHPGPSAFPSKGDLMSFKKLGKIHLIIAAPFTLESTKAFDSNGEEQEIEVIE